MYTPFEYQGSVPQATHAKLEKVVIEENDVTIQYREGYEADGEFTSLGAAHVCMTPAQMISLGTEVAAEGQEIYIASWAHKDAINALQTVEAAENYDTSAGWPE